MMGIEHFFIHSLVLQRSSPGAPDRSGHVEAAFLEENEVAFMGNVQDRRGRELVGENLGGQVVVDAVIFTPVLTMDEGDRIIHGERTYDIKWVKDPAGVSHHLEVGCLFIGSGEVALS
jgi:hypothetical protein